MEEIDSDGDEDGEVEDHSGEPETSQPGEDIVPASQPDTPDFDFTEPVQDVVAIEDSPDKSPTDKTDKTIQNSTELGKLLGMATTRAEIEDKISELNAQLLAAKKKQVCQKLGPSKNSRL